MSQRPSTSMTGQMSSSEDTYTEPQYTTDASATQPMSQGPSPYITRQTSWSEMTYTEPQYTADTTTLKQTTRQTNASPTLLQDGANQMVSKSIIDNQHFRGTIGITVPIGVIVILTVTIVLILLKRRGLLPCIKRRSADKSSDKLAGKASNQDSSDDNGEVHNYFVQEKCVQGNTETFDHSGHYNYIEITLKMDGET
ncbi:uncharacterized protein LOC127861774 [Dreissena polymorpha]|uniref:uncharacterized protein LOC127861774 n=1 Tax=Dreissena polymorpha TaxID=45954 RepID=UPI00226549A4|nr:uncharacterized protein LOC127861774 [Dreissena polymorpha]